MPPKAGPQIRIGVPNYGIPYSDLSKSLDPHSVYVSEALALARKSQPGLERFAYMILGPQFIGSLAFALDPWSEFKFPTSPITPTNRETTIACIRPVARSNQDSVTTEACSNGSDPAQPCGIASTTGAAGVVCSSSTFYYPKTIAATQQLVVGVRKDTTVRTRSPISKGGEFELYLPYLSAPPRFSASRDEFLTIAFANTDCLMQWSEQNYTRRTVGFGPGVRVDPAPFTGFLATERANFTTMVGKHAFGMVRESVPTNRKYSLARNVGELKDLPLLLKRSVEFAKDFSSVLQFKGQGNQYLNLKFGWEATLRAVVDMLKVPEEIARQVNYLIERNGLSTTFSSTRSGISEFPGVNPDTFIDVYPNESGFAGSGAGVLRREWKLRTVLNYTLRFPKVDVPLLREDLLALKWGSNPTPADVYALVPWTWLVDWFSGLGEYIDVLNILAQDKSLFNFGYFTYKAHVKIPVTFSWNRDNDRRTNIDGTVVNTSFVSRSNYSVEMGFKYQRRVDLSTVAGMKVLSEPTTLSTGQFAIVGALLSKFAKSSP